MCARNIIIWPVLLLVGLTGCGPAPEIEDNPITEDPMPDESAPIILFLGDSLTAGYQLVPALAFPALIQRKIDEQGLHYRALNAGVSGDTSTDGLNRLNWLFRQPVDVLVLALGANDALRGQPIDHIRSNLSEIMRLTRVRFPEVRVVLAGMLMPTNYGVEYTQAFREMYEELALEHHAVLIPFLLEGVAGRPELNLRDGIHPTAEGHAIIAETVWSYLGPLL